VIRQLIKIEALTIGADEFSVQYFELRTSRGVRRYSAEILLGPDDRIIFDGETIFDVQVKAARLGPATRDSHKLVKQTAA
jgi:hypothetical protein